MSGVYSIIDMTVNIVGTNNLTGNFTGLYADNSSVILEGDGTLNVTGINLYGIFEINNITINSGTIHATGDAYGLGALGITIAGGSIYATGSNGGLYAINGHITITGGSLIAEGKAGHGTFNRQPSFGNNWYKWRTSKDGAFTDS